MKIERAILSYETGRVARGQSLVFSHRISLKGGRSGGERERRISLRNTWSVGVWYWGYSPLGWPRKKQSSKHFECKVGKREGERELLLGRDEVCLHLLQRSRSISLEHRKRYVGPDGSPHPIKTSDWLDGRPGVSQKNGL